MDFEKRQPNGKRQVRRDGLVRRPFPLAGRHGFKKSYSMLSMALARHPSAKAAYLSIPLKTGGSASRRRRTTLTKESSLSCGSTTRLTKTG